MSSSKILSDNGVSSGTSGIITSGGDDGTLLLQTTTAGGAATTAITIDTSQNVTFAKPFLNPLGSASAPAITFTGDTNTGIYSSGADAIDITTGGTQRGQFDSSGNFKFNSGYGSVAVAYGCRAWVNFNGVPATGTYSRSGTTVTVTLTSHGMTTGQNANMTFAAGTGGTATSGSYEVTVVNANTFTITDTASGTITGSPTATRNSYIRASGNVSSITDNGVGDYTANFTTAMPDVDYVTLPSLDYGSYAPVMMVRTQLTTSVRVFNYADTLGSTDRALLGIAIIR